MENGENKGQGHAAWETMRGNCLSFTTVLRFSAWPWPRPWHPAQVAAAIFPLLELACSVSHHWFWAHLGAVLINLKIHTAHHNEQSSCCLILGSRVRNLGDGRLVQSLVFAAFYHKWILDKSFFFFPFFSKGEEVIWVPIGLLNWRVAVDAPLVAPP